MKKCFLLLPALFWLSCSVRSQVISKGDRLFGGSFSMYIFNNNNNGPGYSTAGNAGLQPSFAWAIKENTVMGIKGSIAYSRSTSVIGADKTTNSSLTAGPGVFLRKYKLLKNKFGVYLNHDLNAFYTKQKQKDGLQPEPVTIDSWGGSYNFNPGVFYKFSDRFLGEANIGGLYMSYTSNGSGDNFGAGASFLQFFNVGINYVIGKK